jgi:hypothetical protein
MCGRYASFLPPEFIARLFGTKNPLPNLKRSRSLRSPAAVASMSIAD